MSKFYIAVLIASVLLLAAAILSIPACVACMVIDDTAGEVRKW